MNSAMSRLRTPILTGAALIAFAANSVLCRIALGQAIIDAGSFSAIRLISGAIVLWAVVTARRRNLMGSPGGNWTSAAMLFLYAAGFSFAYVSLTTGTGALILFGFVQATMFLAALISGERPRLTEWAGLLLAVCGLAYLVFPGLTAPPLLDSALMAAAGIAWGVYSLRGRSAVAPLSATAGNFLRTVPFAFIVIVAAALLKTVHITLEGALLAAASGTLASGVGYAIWYAALDNLTASRAATVQLAVPVIAGAGGVLILGEQISLRLLTATIVILGGIGLAIAGRRRFSNRLHRTG